MNKTELVNALALRTGLSKKSAEDVLTTALDIITETLVLSLIHISEPTRRS